MAPLSFGDVPLLPFSRVHELYTVVTSYVIIVCFDPAIYVPFSRHYTNKHSKFHRDILTLYLFTSNDFLHCLLWQQKWRT